MINTKSFVVLKQSSFGERFMKPVYDSYSFSRIPQTILNILMNEKLPALPPDALPDYSSGNKQVILFFIDAFGWRFFDKYKDDFPFLKRFVADGVASKISSQFPSTTSAHVTCIHTGLPVGKSGIFEWQYYEPKADAMISPLLFSYAGSHRRNELLKDGIEAKDILPPTSIYQQMEARSIPAYILQHIEYVPSVYSDHVFRGAVHIPYKTLPEAYMNLSELLQKNMGKSAYYFMYYDKIDSLCHQYGPDSRQFDAEVRSVLTTLELILMKQLAPMHDILFFVTADHGQVDIQPKTAWYINREMPQLIPWMETTKSGAIKAPGGSCRDMFLYMKPKYVDETVALLRKKLTGKAEVYRVSELVSQGFFGTTHPSKAFLGRVGNIVILPYPNESVWWYEEKKFSVRYFGHHGGLTREEAETVFLALHL